MIGAGGVAGRGADAAVFFVDQFFVAQSFVSLLKNTLLAVQRSGQLPFLGSWAEVMLWAQDSCKYYS